ncbi:MAG: NAD(P)H-dependent oxidoreductase [Phenylobacterium sp.]|uniref:flavodoxin family protein n=1 Tax=Phenylobacterium sp. TaxID=1871053 RepID=UPI002719FB4B|nr:NAD(P)H-dependent oxidoreductase [Phenylobacterium sp.]MDO8901890.1 NAD(P)H-dependent oxidoreductase [Phenylobacterium sp.]
MLAKLATWVFDLGQPTGWWAAGCWNPAFKGPGVGYAGPMKTLLITYHSRTGGSRQMAQAAAEAARGADEVEVRLLEAEAGCASDLLAADGYLFICPENLAAITGEMKAFFDRAYYPVLGQIEGRPYALMVCAGSDGENAVRQMARIATGWRLKAVAAPIIICTHAQTPEAILAPKRLDETALGRCRDLGAAMAAGLALGIY